MYAISYTDPAINNGYNTQVKTVLTRKEANKLRKALIERGVRSKSITIEYMRSGRLHS